MFCQLLLPTPSGRCLVKLAILLVFCCFAESAAGSCIRYGHSCWGAHGKRSHHDNLQKNDALNIKNDALFNDDARWFIARLLQTHENRLLKGLQLQQDENQFEDGKLLDDISSNINTNGNAEGEQLKPVLGLNPNDPTLLYPGIVNDKFRLIKYL